MTSRAPSSLTAPGPRRDRRRPPAAEPSIREVSAGGLVFKRTARGFVFAMMRDSYGKWTFPKGHVERGETFSGAAARETEEELGLKNLRLRGPLGKIDIWFKDRFVKKGALIHKDIHYFLFEAPANAVLHPQAPEGVTDAKWVPAHKVGETSFYRDLEPIISQAQAQLRQQRPRRQGG